MDHLQNTLACSECPLGGRPTDGPQAPDFLYAEVIHYLGEAQLGSHSTKSSTFFVFLSSFSPLPTSFFLLP